MRATELENALMYRRCLSGSASDTSGKAGNLRTEIDGSRGDGGGKLVGCEEVDMHKLRLDEAEFNKGLKAQEETSVWQPASHPSILPTVQHRHLSEVPKAQSLPRFCNRHPNRVHCSDWDRKVKILISKYREYPLSKLVLKKKLDHPLPLVDFYQLFSVARDASLAEIKAAYHRALLTSHPDKRHMHAAHHASRSRSHSSTADRSPSITTAQGDLDTGSAPVDIALLKEAYAVLANAHDRAAYDARLRLRRRPHGKDKTGPRPAAVVSLEDFDLDADGGAEPSDNEDDGAEGPWRYGCRCGGWYRIAAAAMEAGQHLVGCSSCSEVIWVGYEVVSDSESNVEEQEEGT